MEELRRMTGELRKIVDGFEQNGTAQDRSPPRTRKRCWVSNSEKHLQNKCPQFGKDKKDSSQGNEQLSSPESGARR